MLVQKFDRKSQQRWTIIFTWRVQLGSRDAGVKLCSNYTNSEMYTQRNNSGAFTNI